MSETDTKDATSDTGSETMTEASNMGESRALDAEWTIMVYMAGDNNLANDCINALTKMKQVKIGDIVHVIAQFDPSDTRLSSQRVVINLKEKKAGAGFGVAVLPSPSDLAKDRVDVGEGAIKFSDENKGHAPELPVPDVLETDTANPKTLFDFISWSKQHFPATRYMLILAGHSAGVEEGYLLKDENPPEAMKLDGLKQVLSAVQTRLGITLDILGMDSCLMSMVEICYELRGLVKFLVSSQSMTPNPGWPYGQILEVIKEADGKIEADSLAPIIVKEYVNSYVEHAVNSGTSTDLSALRVDTSEEVAKKVKDLVQTLRGKLGQTSFNNAIILSHWEAQSYNGEQFVDLCDFCELLEKHYSDAVVTHKCGEVKKAVNEMVLASCFCGIDYQYSNGVSIYFPWSTIFAYYQPLAFAKEEGADWYGFLSDYVEKTRRAPRGGEGPGLWAKYIVRKVPPYDHGPSSPAHSMRNPPRKWTRGGVSNCIRGKEELVQLFETFQEFDVQI